MYAQRGFVLEQMPEGLDHKDQTHPNSLGHYLIAGSAVKKLHLGKLLAPSSAKPEWFYRSTYFSAYLST